MINLWLREVDNLWFGVAEYESKLVATVTAESRVEAARSLVGCLSAGSPHRFADEPSEFVTATVRMLAEIENGNEANKHFELSPEYVHETVANVLRVAAAIPLGYVSTYGNIAAVAKTNARVVGRLMATNPLYPIVPCHRVVGADFSLVGYGGKITETALHAKLGRLKAEARGYGEERFIAEAGGLRVFPVERVIAKAVLDAAREARQQTLW